MRILPISVGLALMSLPAVKAWGAAGHEIVATIAQMYLYPSVMPTICDILHPSPNSDGAATCTLASIASWADRVRRTPEYSNTATLHYIGSHADDPSTTCAFPGPKGWVGRQDRNVLGAMRNATNILQHFVDGEGGYGREDGEDALKFLVHWVGDMHMPLHLTGKERGGNGAKVLFDGRLTNLHSVWDNFLIASSLRTISRNYTRPLAGDGAAVVESNLHGAIYDPYIRRIMHEGFGVGFPDVGDGRFGTFADWVVCPAVASRPPPPPLSFIEKAQVLLGLSLPRGPKSKDEERWDDAVLCPYAWATPIHQLNCEVPIWPKELDPTALSPLPEAAEEHRDSVEHPEVLEMLQPNIAGKPRPHPGVLELDTPEYTGKIRERWVVETLLAMAGIRLAGILNGLFANEAGYRALA